MAFRGDRLKALRKKLRLSQGELGAKVGLSQKSISDLETGASMETTKLHALAEACGVSPEWLLGRADDDENMRAARMLETIGQPIDENGRRKKHELTSEHYTPREVIQQITKMLAVREIDTRGGASYAGGISDEDWEHAGEATDKVVAKWGLPSDYVESELGSHIGSVDILKVRGDSMDDGSAKGLASGDRVLVDRGDRDVRQGGIFVVFDGAGIIIKQVELVRGVEPPQIVCKSLNTRYSPIALTLELPVRVVGRVAARISRM